MKRSWAKRIGIIGSLLLLTAVAAVFGYLWWQERQTREDMMNQVDYSLVAPNELDTYVRRDLGVSLDELKGRAPQGSFPWAFLAARSLVLAGDEKKALEYYQHAEKQLGGYTHNQGLRITFYSRYFLLAPHMDESVSERVEKEYNTITGGDVDAAE